MWKQLIGMVLAITLGVGAAWFGVQWNLSQNKATNAQVLLPEGGDFTLQGKNGAVKLADFRGKVVVLYFGYTSCPDVCPTSMAKLKAALALLKPEEVQQIQGMLISVDPERDKLDQLQAYASYFHPNILGATGSPDEVQKVAQQYSVLYRKVPMPGSALGYSVDHSSLLYIIDKQGKLQAELNHATTPQEVADALRRWL